MNRYWIVLAAAMLTAIPTSSRSREVVEVDFTGPIRELLKKHPATFELTIMTHYSDDDLGFHVQTAPVPAFDSLYPMHRISEEQASAIVRELSKTPFVKKAQEGGRADRFRPEKPDPVRRVYSITLRCGERAFFEDVQSDAEMKKRADAISEALKGSEAGRAFGEKFGG